jgi:hypothetical protein
MPRAVLLGTKRAKGTNGEVYKKDNVPTIGSGDLLEAKKPAPTKTPPKKKSTMHIGE